MSSVSDALKLIFQLTAYDDSLEVRATAPAGEGKGKTTLPPPDLLKQLIERDPTNIPSSVLERVGKALYQCLMVGDIAQLASEVLQDGMRSKRPVWFELRLDADQVSLAQYPWEMIVDDFGRFLVRDGLVDITRYITYPQPPPTFDAPLHDVLFLRVISQPRKLPSFDVVDLETEKIETLRHATFDQLQFKLLIERMALWGLYFHGHGALKLQCRNCDTVNDLQAKSCRKCSISLSGAKQVGALAFESNGEPDWISTEQFGSVLYNAEVQLVLLLSCETARVGDCLVFSGFAPGLILAGIPAVVGMQYPVLTGFANNFAESFYNVLREQHDVMDALRTARRMNIRGAWYSPVLYLRHQKATRADESVKPAYHTRNIDTAVPAEVQAGVNFLVRLWIRRPEREPLTQKKLRGTLGVPESVPVSTHVAEANVKFEPVEGRALRLGEVEVRLHSTHCDITPESVLLFVDEHTDAPPAIFTVRARQVGRAPLTFSVWQDGAQIASVTHYVQVIEGTKQPKGIIETESYAVSMRDIVPKVFLPGEGKSAVEPETYIATSKESIVQRQPEKPGELFNRAQGAFDSKDWERAIALLRQIISQKPEYPGAQELLGEARKCESAQIEYETGLGYFNEGKWPQAIEKFEAARRDDPEHDDAQEKLKEAQRQADIARLLGEVDEHRRKSEWEQVVTKLKKALELAPDSEEIKQQLDNAEVEYLYQTGEQHFESKRWRAAADCFEQLEKRQPGYKAVSLKRKKIEKQLHLEELYHQAGEYEQAANWLRARDLYNQINSMDPAYKDVASRLAHCDEQLRLPKEKAPDKKSLDGERRGGNGRGEKGKGALSRRWQFCCFVGGVILATLIVLFWARDIRCLIYGTPDGLITLIVLLIGVAAGGLASILPDMSSNTRKALRCISGGAACVLIFIVLWAMVSPPSREECSKTTPTPTVQTNTPTPFPAHTATSAHTPNLTLTGISILGEC